MQPNSKRIAVLGAGLQGACLALELAARGARVDLYERNDRYVAEASAHNEGKIHLGYVYAYDRSFETARLMAAGALCFEALLQRWIGDEVTTLPTSSPFNYVVHHGGLITPDDFERHAVRLAGWIAERNGTKALRYWGRDPRRVPERRAGGEMGMYRPATTAAVFATEEVGIDPEALAGLVRRRLAAEPDIRCLTGRTVVGVDERDRYLVVHSTHDGCRDTEGYDHVVNTLWSGRLAIDSQLGLCPDRPWSFRFRYFLRAVTDAENIPSTTIVLGPFGGIVNFGGGSICLSWYSAGRASWSTAVCPPSIPSVLDGVAAAAVRDGTLEGLATVVPAVTDIQMQDVQVKGAWIFAWGNTDIDDPGSELHRRSAIGVRRHGRYLTIDTGKLTVAPLFAELAAKMVLE